MSPEILICHEQISISGTPDSLWFSQVIATPLQAAGIQIAQMHTTKLSAHADYNVKWSVKLSRLN